jgi:predicted ferric reductase
MDQRLLCKAWLGVFGGIVVAPALLWLLSAPTVPVWEGLSVLTGLLALSALVCAGILPSRVRSLNRALGIENVVEAHRVTGVTAAGLVLLHMACVVAADPANAMLLDPLSAPARARWAVLATVALVVIVVLAVMRRRAQLSYEAWRASHVLLAVVVFLGSAMHVALLGQLVRDPLLGPLLALLAAIVVVVLGHRMWRSHYDTALEFVVREVRIENPTASTLSPPPRRRGGNGGCFAFAPGQFAWIRLDRSPTAEEHPFTIASSAHCDTTEFTIRQAGDFTRAVRRLTPGSPVWVDGPHGGFTNDARHSGGFVLIAGGVGITPMMSMIRTAADRGDHRPYRLVVVASKPEDLLFRDELAALRNHLDLDVVEILRRPVPGWVGPIGGITPPLLDVVRGSCEEPEEIDYFICGPPALVQDTLAVLDELRVPPVRVHTEQFDFV